MTIQKSGVNTVDQRTAVQNLKKPSTQVVVGDVSTEKEDSSDLSYDTSTSESEDEKGLRGLRAVSPDLPSTRGRNVATVIEKTPLEQDANAKKVRRLIPWTICLSHCRYEVVRNVSRKYGLYEVNEDEQWNIYWTDYSVSIERAMDMRRYQLINHFPGMNEICRKDLLARNLNRMKALFGSHYDIYPKTWSLPADLHELQNYALCKRNKIYICKPEMGCQGRGIFLIRNIKDLNPFGKIVCQLYLTKPFLIDGYKFDLRLYVLITSCDPLRIYLYKDGLARFATALYNPPTNSNSENAYMHLTNYAVNKFSRDYVVDDDCGSKRKLTSVWRWLREHGYNVDNLLAEIDDVIIKTVLAAIPMLKQNYSYCFPDRTSASACFEILGFDLLLDDKLKPYLLEVNHSPSFHTNTPIDVDIKEALLNDTFAMLNFKKLNRHKLLNEERKRIRERLMQTKSGNESVNSKQTKQNESDTKLSNSADAQFAHEVANCGGYRLIYPGLNSEKYELFFDQKLSLFQETAASQARAKCVQSQIQEHNHKKLMDEKKRVGGPKESTLAEERLLLPEGHSTSEKAPTKIKAKTLTRKIIPPSFIPKTIKPVEELQRLKDSINRGILVRSLGIEAQAFKLLCHTGNIKPEEEMAYGKMYGNGRADGFRE